MNSQSKIETQAHLIFELGSGGALAGHNAVVAAS
jgi:hypothetical protein